ncbi:MAG: hypothetical protein R2865_05695 [Deinococcales bacterium]
MGHHVFKSALWSFQRVMLELSLMSLAGCNKKNLGEGLKLVLPVVQQVSLYDAREQSFTFATDTDANDSFIEALSQEGLQIEADATHPL